MNATDILNNKSVILKKIDQCGILIQARMLSHRFPGKMLSLISNIPLVEYIYRRCKTSLVNKVFIITSTDKSDDILYNYCKKNNLLVIRGSLNNVLERYIEAGDLINIDYIVRVCGDTPFVDMPLINTFLEILIGEKLDYVSVNRETCASGFYSETFTLDTLKRIAKLTNIKENLEHVTRFIFDKKDKFSTKFIDVDLNPEFVRQIRLTIDYPEDIKKANVIIDELENKISYTSKEVLDILYKKKVR